jgi:hypothetical protein
MTMASHISRQFGSQTRGKSSLQSIDQMSVLQRVCGATIATAAAYASFKVATCSDEPDPRPHSSLLRTVLPVIRAQEPAPVPNDAVPADSVQMPKPVLSPYAACKLSCFTEERLSTDL